MLTVTNLRPYGNVPYLGYDFDVNIADYIGGLGFFVTDQGKVNVEIISNSEPTFTPRFCHDLYHALVEAAPDGMVLLPEEEAMKQVKGEG